MFDGKTAINTTVSSGGAFIVGSTTISSMAFSGTATGTTILNGGLAVDGATMTSTTVSSGGQFGVGGSGTVNGTASFLVGTATA
jgi:hypothetical protein